MNRRGQISLFLDKFIGLPPPTIAFALETLYHLLISGKLIFPWIEKFYTSKFNIFTLFDSYIITKQLDAPIIFAKIELAIKIKPNQI